jgi:carbamoyltransferase
MNEMPRVLGINRTQDASICVVSGESQICSIQKERLTREKHHWGRVGDLSRLYFERLPDIKEPIDLVVECYSSDPEFKNASDYDRELAQVVQYRNGGKKLRISHHLAHLYSTFFISPFDEAAVMVIDCAGSPARDFTESLPDQANIPPDWVEVSSFYECSKEGVRCLSKQTWDADWSTPVGLGCFYFLLTRAMFPGEGNEGKVMGLAPYGDPHALDLPPLIVEREKVFIPSAWLEVFKERSRFKFFVNGSGSFQECADLAAAGQRCFEDALLSLARMLHRETNMKNLCFTGGTALNCVANGRLLRESPFERIFVPPSPHDGGTALGCALYGWIEHLHMPGDFRWVNDFLGPEPETAAAVEQLLRKDDGLVVEKPDDLIEKMVDLLVSGRIVSLFQGRSELGPRALGHRSILADPRLPRIRSWINRNVKGRELFRPLAPAVLLEAASTFFEIDSPVPFMQFAASVRPEYRELIPAVTHVDGTARLQTVSRDEDPFFYSLIKAFEARTGIGVLLNTSFNGKGEPIVETPHEAIACFKSTAMHALAMPPFLIRKRVESPLPD